jgi:hypothetical protein
LTLFQIHELGKVFTLDLLGDRSPNLLQLTDGLPLNQITKKRI